MKTKTTIRAGFPGNPMPTNPKATDGVVWDDPTK